MTDSTAIVTRYLHLLETFETDPTAFQDVLHPEIEQTEFPNALNPRGQQSDWADLFRRAALGRQLLATQAYRVDRITAAGDSVVVEAFWTGTLATGKAMRANFCMAFELRDGLIWRQRNYDCFAV
jgi:ketosteroid isomerase-like protein